MNNSNMPAMPTDTVMAYFAQEQPGITGSGLTKREYFAGLAMQSIIVGRPNVDYDEAADHAIKHADFLLQGLADSYE